MIYSLIFTESSPGNFAGKTIGVCIEINIFAACFK